MQADQEVEQGHSVFCSRGGLKPRRGREQGGGGTRTSIGRGPGVRGEGRSGCHHLFGSSCPLLLLHLLLLFLLLRRRRGWRERKEKQVSPDAPTPDPQSGRRGLQPLSPPPPPPPLTSSSPAAARSPPDPPACMSSPDPDPPESLGPEPPFLSLPVRTGVLLG